MKSMSERLAFPMYAVNDEDTQALWWAVRQLLAARGVVDEDGLRMGCHIRYLRICWRTGAIRRCC